MSVDLQLCDILGEYRLSYSKLKIIMSNEFVNLFFRQDFCKISKPVRDRIQIIESDNESEANNDTDLIAITLQGEEGRKSRVKFLISKVVGCVVEMHYHVILNRYGRKWQFVFFFQFLRTKSLQMY
jgi:hypothetical protein